ncbi:MAG TPA: site-specific DNA-methyltransferase [Persephonella sp.]|nr:site-specific DNA-methyltransferase [Persephonella sp.]
MDSKQRFLSLLKELYVGSHIQNEETGYINLLKLKSQYFEEIKKLIDEKTNELVDKLYPSITIKEDQEKVQEIYDKVYTFFDNYISEGGTIFFSSTPVYKNIYAKVYSDREDVSLFWKTKDLYYVKTENIYGKLENVYLEEEGKESIKANFYPTFINGKNANEKKDIIFLFTGLSKTENEKEIVLNFHITYNQQIKYDKLKEILKIDKPDKIKAYIEENISEISLKHPQIKVFENSLNFRHISFVKSKKDKAKAEIYIFENENGILLLPAITDVSEIVKYLKLLHKNEGLKAFNPYLENEEIIKELQKVYRKQAEIDFFIHKNARAFLKEQFHLYMYNYLTSDTEDKIDMFDQERLNFLRAIKEVAHFIINKIADFEDELKKIWLKPKFVLNSNYVISLDRIRDFEVLKEIIKSLKEKEADFKENLKDLQKIKQEYKSYKERFENYQPLNQLEEWFLLDLIEENFEVNDILKDGNLNEKYQFLPIDTKFLGEELKFKILESFEDLDKALDGYLIKSDNFQALNTILPKFKEQVQTIYIDPPFNKEQEADYHYNVKYKDSTWITLLENRLSIAYNLLNDKGSIFAKCDYNGNMYVRMLLNNIFGKENFISELIWKRFTGTKIQYKGLPIISDTIYFFSKEKTKFKYFQKFRPYDEEYITTWFKYEDEKGKYLLRNFYSPGDGPPRIFFGKKISPPKGHHWRFSQEKIDKLIDEGKIILDSSGFPKLKMYIHEAKGKPYDNLLVDFHVVQGSSSEFWDFKTQNPETLLKLFITSTSEKNDLIMDFFLGSGTTTAVAHKLKRKWIGIELGDHFYTVILPRMKKVLAYDKSGISKDEDVKQHYNEKNAGGFFKYYELESYEDTLKNAVYNPLPEKKANINLKPLLTYSEKLSNKGLQIDWQKEKAYYTFEKLYQNIDLAETISNLIGAKIKKQTKDTITLYDPQTKQQKTINLKELTFEEYPFLKPLIWWE